MNDHADGSQARLWPEPTEFHALFPSIRLEDWQWAEGECCMYAACDSGGERYRIILSRGQLARDGADAEVLKRFANSKEMNFTDISAKPLNCSNPTLQYTTEWFVIVYRPFLLAHRPAPRHRPKAIGNRHQQSETTTNTSTEAGAKTASNY